MGIEKVGIVWHEYCTNNRVLKILLPIGVPMLLVTAVLRILQSFISLGSIASIVIYVLFMLSILLAFANSAYQIMAISFGLSAFSYLCSFLIRLIKRWHVFDWSLLLYILIWGFFAYLAYKKSFKVNS